MRFPLLFVSGMAERLASFAIKCLAVGGGFLAGYLLGGAIAYALDRWAFNKKAPDLVKKSIRIVSGLVLAILVALIVFGEGGGGLGLGGGEGKGTGTPSGEGQKEKTPTPAPPDKDRQVSPATPADTRPTEVTVRVTVLGGSDVVQERFYLLDDDRTPKTFAEVRAAVTARKAAEKRKMTLAILFPPPPNRVPIDHGAVTQLVKWARDEAGLDVTFPAGR